MTDKEYPKQCRQCESSESSVLEDFYESGQ